MSLIAIGLNYQNTPLAIRERLAIPRPALPEALQDLKARTGVQEAVILSTCNRTELYCASPSEPSMAAVDSWLGGYHDDGEVIKRHLYRHTGEAAVRHVMRVASGLDSMVLGEPQVLGQLKMAWRDASSAGSVGVLLDRLLQYSFATAKEVRSNTAIGHSPVSIATIGVRLARQIFSSLNQSTALLIGAGEIIDATAKHLHQTGIGKMIIANRTLEKAQQLARKYQGFAIELDALQHHLAEVDIVISCTAKQGYIVSWPLLSPALAKRRHRPMFLIDLAVPRDLDPEIANCPDAYLYTIDDLRQISEQNLDSRRDAINLAEHIVDNRSTDFMSWLNDRTQADAIKELHEESWCRQKEINQAALSSLQQGGDPAAVLEKATRELTGKLLHGATTKLKHGRQLQKPRSRRGQN